MQVTQDCILHPPSHGITVSSCSRDAYQLCVAGGLAIPREGGMLTYLPSKKWVRRRARGVGWVPAFCMALRSLAWLAINPLMKSTGLLPKPSRKSRRRMCSFAVLMRLLICTRSCKRAGKSVFVGLLCCQTRRQCADHGWRACPFDLRIRGNVVDECHRLLVKGMSRHIEVHVIALYRCRAASARPALARVEQLSSTSPWQGLASLLERCEHGRVSPDCVLQAVRLGCGQVGVNAL